LSNLKIRPSADGNVKVSLEITNTGDRNGAEVVQLYVKDLESSVDRPEKELKEFQKVEIDSGEKKTVEFILGDDAFAFWDDDAKKWVVEPGIFEIRVGSSSKDIRLVEQVEL
jgi:beta-glucosidase